MLNRAAADVTTRALLRRSAQALAVTAVAGLLALLIWRVVNESGGAASSLASGHHPPAPLFTLPGSTGRDGSRCARSAAAWSCSTSGATAASSSLGLDAQDLISDARNFIRHHRITYPNVRDGGGSTLGRYGVTGFPETFFVGGADG